MTDTHTHLYFAESYPEGCAEAVDRGVAAGVGMMVLPNVSVASCEPLISLHHARPESTSIAVGLHPEDIDADWRMKVEDVFARFADEGPCAVGEVGVDLYHDDRFRHQQMDAFGEQLDRARVAGLPVIIHSRSALDETLQITGMMGSECPPLLFHSFTMGPSEARRILEAHPDAVFGINGVVTFKNAPDLREAVKEIGISRIVLETDAPYLAPVPLRGRTNESSYLPYINSAIADLFSITPSESGHITDSTARKFFNNYSKKRL